MKLYSTQYSSGRRASREKDAYWFPKVALYTGLRLNKISAIPLAHIKEKDRVWYFDLEGLEVKNASSGLTVPIAQYLLDLGLLGYVNSLKQNAESLLFFQIRLGKVQPGSSGWGDSISRVPSRFSWSKKR